jgi:hypothetical protein
MLAYHTSADSTGQRWRIEVTDKIRIYRLAARGITRRQWVLRDLKDLDGWLAERGWTFDDLEQVSRPVAADAQRP